MSTLTKIFTVLMVVFSIAFTMTTINFVAKTNDWKKLATDYQLQQQVVETHMRQLSAAHAAEKTAWLDTEESLQDRITNLETAQTELRGEIATQQDEVARLRAEKSNGEALSRRLASELQVAQNGWNEQSQQREAIEKRNLDLQRRNLDLDERVNEQTAQILVLVQQQKQLEQQINILREENKKLAGTRPSGLAPPSVAAAGMPSVTPLTPPAATPIRGQIVEVQGNIATVSVGSADGVQEGMVFVIFRGSEYVGDLEITDVEPNLAAGRIISSRSTPRPHDMVADEPALGFAQ